MQPRLVPRGTRLEKNDQKEIRKINIHAGPVNVRTILISTRVFYHTKRIFFFQVEKDNDGRKLSDGNLMILCCFSGSQLDELQKMNLVPQSWLLRIYSQHYHAVGQLQSTPVYLYSEESGCLPFSQEKEPGNFGWNLNIS